MFLLWFVGFYDECLNFCLEKKKTNSRNLRVFRNYFSDNLPCKNQFDFIGLFQVGYTFLVISCQWDELINSNTLIIGTFRIQIYSHWKSKFLRFQILSIKINSRSQKCTLITDGPKLIILPVFFLFWYLLLRLFDLFVLYFTNIFSFNSGKENQTFSHLNMILKDGQMSTRDKT